MRFQGFNWDQENQEHVARHGVTPEECEELFVGKKYTRRTKGGAYVTLGTNSEGRYLVVVWAKRPGGRIHPITAREMSDSQRRTFDRRKR